MAGTDTFKTCEIYLTLCAVEQEKHIYQNMLQETGFAQFQGSSYDDFHWYCLEKFVTSPNTFWLTNPSGT